MLDSHVYRIIELAGSSEEGIEDAIDNAIEKAGASVRHMRWFEVQTMRGHIKGGEVAHYQVVLKVGFTLDEPRAV